VVSLKTKKNNLYCRQSSIFVIKINELKTGHTVQNNYNNTDVFTLALFTLRIICRVSAKPQ